MKYRVLRKVVIARRWANTEKGERTIVRVLSAMTLVLMADVALLVVGFSL